MSDAVLQKTTDRNQAADALRGAAAVMVIVGHLFARDTQQFVSAPFFNYFVSCIHVGIFFFFAGYFAKSGLRKKLAGFAAGKALRLLVPYAAWTTLAIGAKTAMGFLRGTLDLNQTLKDWVHALVYGDNVWFFLSLFVMQMFFWCIYRCFRWKKWAGYLCLAALYLLPMPGEFMLHKTQTMLPFLRQVCCMLVGNRSCWSLERDGSGGCRSVLQR